MWQMVLEGRREGEAVCGARGYKEMWGYGCGSGMLLGGRGKPSAPETQAGTMMEAISGVRGQAQGLPYPSQNGQLYPHAERRL